MDLISEGCRLCLDAFAECFTTINNQQLKVQMGKVFCFPIEPKQGYSSGVCQNCAYAISEFYQYSEKVRQNQEVLNKNEVTHEPTVYTEITLESVKVETPRDPAFPETTEDACQSKDGVLGEDGFLTTDDDKSYEPSPKKSRPNRLLRLRKSKYPAKKSQTKQALSPRNSKLDEFDTDEPTKNSEHTTMRRIHERNEQDRLFNKHIRMICDLCGTSVATFTELRSHFNKEHKQRYCYVVCCNKKLFHRYKIQDHIDFHDNPDLFRCEVCGIKYKNKINLKKHLSNEQSCKDRMLVCNICDKTFRIKQCLEQHLLIEHLGIEVQRFQCEICRRWFKNEANLKSHNQYKHTKGDELQCDICLQKCKHSRALAVHKYQKHKESTHECEFCGKKFRRELILKEHRTTHTGEYLYACDYCGITNSNSSNLYKHVKRKHPTEWAEKKLKATQNTGTISQP